MMGPPTAQPPSRSRSGSKMEVKTKHRLTGSVSDVPYSPEELSSADAPGNGNSTSGGSSSASLKDKKIRRRTRSSLGGTEDLVRELDSLVPVSNKSGSRESTPTPPPTPPAGVRPANSPGTEYPALKARPTDPGEDFETALPVVLSGSEAVTGNSSSDKESFSSGKMVGSSEGPNEPAPEETTPKVDSSARVDVNHTDVVELETQRGSAVQLKAGAYSTNEDKDLWICRQCGWTYPNAHPSAKHRRNHRKVCEKLYTGVEVPPGSSDDASSDDELKSEDQASTTGSSTTTPQTPVKADTKDDPVKKPGAVPRTFTKPTISTGSESSKNSPVTSPGKRDSPFNSPAKRDSHLASPAKKETPWGSPMKRTTPVSSPSTSRKVSSPITSPVKRIMSAPVKRNSPPRPEKVEGNPRTLTAKQQQEEEEKNISVKKRIEELERITGSKHHTWKDYVGVGEGRRSGELSSSGSPLRHGDDERRKSGEMSPSGKPLKPVEAGGRKSAEFSPGTISGRPLRHIHSSKKSGELSSTGSPLMHSVDGRSHKTTHIGEVSELHTASSEDQKSFVSDASVVSPADADARKVVAQESLVTDSEKIVETKAEIPEIAGEPVRVSGGMEGTTNVKNAVTETPVEKVQQLDPVVTPSVEKLQAAGAIIFPSSDKSQATEDTVLECKKVEDESKVALPGISGHAQDESAKEGTEVTVHSQRPSLVLEKENVSLLTGADVPQDSGVVLSSLKAVKLSGPIVDYESAQKEAPVPEVITRTESSLEETGTHMDAENALVNKVAPQAKEAEAITKERSGTVVDIDPLPVKVQSSAAVVAPILREDRVQSETSSSKTGNSSEVLAAKAEEKAEVPAAAPKVASPADVVSVQPLVEKTLSSEDSSERTVTNPESQNTISNASPRPRPVDHDDDTSVLLTKQPAVDPLFVDSQQDRLWEMHSQELTRRDGDTSGADVRESSAQDDDPIQYANGSPLTPEASASGTTSNGNGVNEKGGKVDRPRTPLRSLIAEDDAADKGGDEGAPTGKETPIVSPRGNLFKRIVSGGKASPTKPSTPAMYEKKSHSKPFLSSCMCCSPVK